MYTHIEGHFHLVVHSDVEKLYDFIPLVKELLGKVSCIKSYFKHISKKYSSNTLDIQDIVGFNFFYVSSQMLDSTAVFI